MVAAEWEIFFIILRLQVHQKLHSLEQILIKSLTFLFSFSNVQMFKSGTKFSNLVKTTKLALS